MAGAIRLERAEEDRPRTQSVCQNAGRRFSPDATQAVWLGTPCTLRMMAIVAKLGGTTHLPPRDPGSLAGSPAPRVRPLPMADAPRDLAA